MTILVLGVDDKPYVDVPDKPKKVRLRRGGKRPIKVKNPAAAHVTTGDVAGYLENKYHVMDHFFEYRKQDIADLMANAAAGALESAMQGGTHTLVNPFASGVTGVEKMFKAFIDLKVMDSLGYPGIPTKAAKKGIRSRFKDRLDPGRPSFQDTGLYEQSFMAWIK